VASKAKYRKILKAGDTGTI